MNLAIASAGIPADEHRDAYVCRNLLRTQDTMRRRNGAPERLYQTPITWSRRWTIVYRAGVPISPVGLAQRVSALLSRIMM
jgi:hypothetical protein